MGGRILSVLFHHSINLDFHKTGDGTKQFWGDEWHIRTRKLNSHCSMPSRIPLNPPFLFYSSLNKETKKLALTALCSAEQNPPPPPPLSPQSLSKETNKLALTPHSLSLRLPVNKDTGKMVLSALCSAENPPLTKTQTISHGSVLSRNTPLTESIHQASQVIVAVTLVPQGVQHHQAQHVNVPNFVTGQKGSDSLEKFQGKS